MLYNRFNLQYEHFILHESKIKAADIMITSVYSVRPNDQILDVTKMLCKKKYSGAPVTTDNKELVGMLSEKDCIDAFLNSIYHNTPLSQVKDLMTRKVISVTEDTNILTLAHLFVSKGLRRIPVVRDGILVGQISRRDLLHYAIYIIEEPNSREASTLYLSALDRDTPPF
jgi:predicted transcriptional regulator|tara:strand:- start:609 stop:1118 length:510 start_codon:yes stop_codon:yes gene_type:complete